MGSARKHPAPEGALRYFRVGVSRSLVIHFRKHPAPEGALRRDGELFAGGPGVRQKAPRTTRCIKT